MRYYRRKNLEPRWITARFASECKCGKQISQGDRIFYYPISRTAYCQTCSEQHERDYAAAVQDEEMGGY